MLLVLLFADRIWGGFACLRIGNAAGAFQLR